MLNPMPNLWLIYSISKLSNSCNALCLQKIVKNSTIKNFIVTIIIKKIKTKRAFKNKKE